MSARILSVRVSGSRQSMQEHVLFVLLVIAQFCSFLLFFSCLYACWLSSPLILLNFSVCVFLLSSFNICWPLWSFSLFYLFKVPSKHKGTERVKNFPGLVFRRTNVFFILLFFLSSYSIDKKTHSICLRLLLKHHHNVNSHRRKKRRRKTKKTEVKTTTH